MLKLIDIQASSAKIATNVPNSAANPTIRGRDEREQLREQPASAIPTRTAGARIARQRDALRRHEPVDERHDADEQHERADRRGQLDQRPGDARVDGTAVARRLEHPGRDRADEERRDRQGDEPERHDERRAACAPISLRRRSPWNTFENA